MYPLKGNWEVCYAYIKQEILKTSKAFFRKTTIDGSLCAK